MSYKSIKAIADSMNSPNEFNIHLVYIYKFSIEMDRYIAARYDDEFNFMYIALDNLDTLAIGQADIKGEDEKKEFELLNKTIIAKLDWIYDHKDDWFSKDDKGNIGRVDEGNKKIIRKELNTCLRLILRKLDLLGILRKLRIDPGKAMSNFDA